MRRPCGSTALHGKSFRSQAVAIGRDLSVLHEARQPAGGTSARRCPHERSRRAAGTPPLSGLGRVRRGADPVVPAESQICCGFGAPPLREVNLSVDSTTASELPSTEIGRAAWPYLVGGPDYRSRSAASGRVASVIANHCSGSAAGSCPRRSVLPGVYLLQRCGRLAATGATSPHRGAVVLKPLPAQN
jgi:hypothetical protein